jgi:hypothetical protein
MRSRRCEDKPTFSGAVVGTLDAAPYEIAGGVDGEWAGVCDRELVTSNINKIANP